MVKLSPTSIVAPSRSSARKCVSMRRRPMTSPPGGGSTTLPNRASNGPASRIEARIRVQSSGSAAGLRRHGVSMTTVLAAVHSLDGTEVDEQLEQRLDVANPRNVVERDRAVGEQCRGDHRAGPRSCFRRDESSVRACAPPVTTKRGGIGQRSLRPQAMARRR